MEFWKYFVFKVSLLFFNKNSRILISDKFYNPYNKAPQKYLEFFDKFG